jgi:hypothetical protein
MFSIFAEQYKELWQTTGIFRVNPALGFRQVQMKKTILNKQLLSVRQKELTAISEFSYAEFFLAPH